MESTSIERQRELIENWARDNDHEVVGWAEDVDVSGGVDPFDTPELGPWLTDERKGEWDILCAWKMDRLARRTVPLHRLFGWVQDNDKTLVCISDNIDLGHWVGRLVASVIAGVAEGELEAIRERATASKKKLRELGRYSGGRLPYGYSAEPIEGGGWRLVQDPVEVAVIRKLIEQVLDGTTTGALARELTDAGVPTPMDRERARNGKAPRGGGWHRITVDRILRSKTLMGWTLHEGVTVRDADGNPVLRGEPIIDLVTYNRIQEILNSRKIRSSARNTSPLLGVALCAVCESNLYLRKIPKEGKEGEFYLYYMCNNKCFKHQVNGHVLHQETYDTFLAELGEAEEHEEVVRPANDNAAKIADLQLAIEELTELAASMTSGAGIASFSKQIKALDEELTLLEATHSAETLVEWRSTGRTYAEVWEASNAEERRQLMLKSGFRVKAQSGELPGTVAPEFVIPKPILDSLRVPRADLTP